MPGYREHGATCGDGRQALLVWFWCTEKSEPPQRLNTALPERAEPARGRPLPQPADTRTPLAGAGLQFSLRTGKLGS